MKTANRDDRPRAPVFGTPDLPYSTGPLPPDSPAGDVVARPPVPPDTSATTDAPEESGGGGYGGEAAPDERWFGGSGWVDLYH